MTNPSRAASEFAPLFIKALTDKEGGREKTLKEKEGDYYRLTFFIHGLVKLADFDVCLTEYLSLYLNYLPADRRSKFIFAVLLAGRIDRTPIAAPYLEALSNALLLPQSPLSPVSARFQDLAQQEKDQILVPLKGKLARKKETETILDLLRNEFLKQYGYLPKSNTDLYDFDPYPKEVLKSDLEKELNSVQKAWNICRFGNEDTKRLMFHTTLDHYRLHLAGVAKQGLLQLFQVIKYLQDPLATRRESMGTWNKRIDGDRSPLMCELYAMACLELLVIAQGKLALRSNRLRFTPEEQAYFLKPLRDPSYEYISNLEDRFDSDLANVARAFDLTKAFLDFILLTKNQIDGASLVPLKETLRIQKIWMDIAELTSKFEKADQAEKKRLLADNKNLRIAQQLNDLLKIEVPLGEHDLGTAYARVGASPGVHKTFGRVTLIHIDLRNPLLNDFYIEYEALKPHLFLVHKDYIIEKVYASRIYGVYKSTAGIVYVVEGMFMMMGFMPAFIESGFAGLSYEILIYYGSSKLEEQAEKINPIFGKIVGFAAQILVPRPNFKPKIVDPRNIARMEAKAFAFTELKGTTSTEARGAVRFDAPWLERATTEIEAEQRGLGREAKSVEGTPSRPQHQQLQRQQQRLQPGSAKVPAKKAGSVETTPSRPKHQQLQPLGQRLKQGSTETLEPPKDKGSESNPTQQAGETGAAAQDATSGKGTEGRGIDDRVQAIRDRANHLKPSRGTGRSTAVADEWTSARQGSRGARYRIDGDRAEFEASKQGHHVYEYLDEDGRLLYVGKSGSIQGEGRIEPLPKGQAEPPFHNWIDRLRNDHITTPWIGVAKRVRVTYGLSEPEMFALEEVRIDTNWKKTWNWNEKQGEFSSRYRGEGVDLYANAKSAVTRPREVFTIETHPVSW